MSRAQIVPGTHITSIPEDDMYRWMGVPFALTALLVLTPTSEGRGRRCSSGCGYGSAGCAPSYCIVGYRTEMRTVVSHEWSTEKRKVKVTEWTTEKVKEKVTRHKMETVTEKRPYTYWVNEMQKQTRKQDYWVCKPITVEEDRTYIIHEEIRTPKKATKQVCKTVEEEQPYKYTVDKGTWETRMEERVCRSWCGCAGPTCYTTTVCRHVWVPKLVTVETKIKVCKNIVVEEPYEYVELSYKPVEKKDKVKVTRYQHVKQTRDVDVWVCVAKEMKGEQVYSYCKWTPVTEEVMVEVAKPVTVERDIEVRVCKPVSRQVEVQVPIYGCLAASDCCK